MPPVQPIAGVGEVVMAHELPDGRFNLVVRGRARVRIDEELPSDRPYRLVSATRAARRADRRRRPSCATPTSRCARSSASWPTRSPRGASCCARWSPPQETPAELVDGVASALIVDPALRQRLLETRDVGKRIERVAAEVVAMTARIGAPGSAN